MCGRLLTNMSLCSTWLWKCWPCWFPPSRSFWGPCWLSPTRNQRARDSVGRTFSSHTSGDDIKRDIITLTRNEHLNVTPAVCVEVGAGTLQGCWPVCGNRFFTGTMVSRSCSRCKCSPVEVIYLFPCCFEELCLIIWNCVLMCLYEDFLLFIWGP